MRVPRVVGHYFGRQSAEFWRRVLALPSPDSDALYAAGALLQNMEGTVLRWLVNAEAVAKTERRRARAARAPKKKGKR